MIHKSYLHESSGFERRRAARSALLSTSPPYVSFSQEKHIKTYVIDERFMIELNRELWKISESKFHDNIESGLKTETKPGGQK